MQYHCYLLLCLSVSDEDYVIVNTPPFAESVTEGDVRWEKGKEIVILLEIFQKQIHCSRKKESQYG